MATAVSCVPSSAHSRAAPPPPLAVCENRGQFAFAQIQCDVCLVQLSQADVANCSSPLTAIEAKVFRHEFITIFRYSHPALIHPNDFRLLELVEDRHLLHEEEKETVFLSREMMGRLQQLTRRQHSIPSPTSPSRFHHGSRMHRRRS